MSNSAQPSSTKTEKQIELLKKKIQELTTENQILRDINVKLQIENFNLQKKLENQTIEEELESLDKSIEKPDVQAKAPNETFYDYIQEEEYLEPDETVYLQQDEVKTIQVETNGTPNILTVKRKCENVFDGDQLIDDEPATKQSKSSDSQYTFEVIGNESDEDIFDHGAFEELLTPKEAMQCIYRLAAKRSMFEKVKNIEKGKAKDSVFVNKALDLLFDRVTLANSTANGQKCQSKLHLTPKPALDGSKMDICLKAFMYRLQQEEISNSEMESRVKNFNRMVNDKIQNSRKCLIRSDALKYDNDEIKFEI